MDFLLVRHSNLGPILDHFRDMAGFLVLMTPILFHVGLFPLQQITHVGVSPSINLKLISREIIFAVFQHHGTWTSQTDRRTDTRHTVA